MFEMAKSDELNSLIETKMFRIVVQDEEKDNLQKSLSRICNQIYDDGRDTHLERPSKTVALYEVKENYHSLIFKQIAI